MIFKKPHSTILLFSGLAWLGCSCLVEAANPIRSGQWETTIKMNMHNMPQLSEEQLSQLEGFGIELPIGNKPLYTLQCITPEQAKLENPMLPPNGEGCAIKNYRRQGNRVAGDMVCTGSIQATGRFDMLIKSDTAFQGTWTLTGNSDQLGPIDQTTEISGQWIKTKCDANAPIYPTQQ